MRNRRRLFLLSLALLPAGDAIAGRQQLAPELALPPQLRGKRIPPMEEIGRLKGPEISIEPGKTNLQTVVYGSPELREWVEPVLQPGFRETPPAWVRIEKRPAGELLTAVTAALHAVLRPARGAAVITDCPGLELWVALGQGYTHLDPRYNARKFVWAPGQLEILDRGGRIWFAQLRPDQQDLIRSDVWGEYATQTAIGPEALLLRDVFLEMDREELEFDGRRSIATYVPVLGGRWPRWISARRRDGAVVGPPSSGTYSRAPADLPASLTGKHPPCPMMKRINPAEEAALRTLLPPLPQGETTIDSCLLHLVKHAKISCLAATYLSGRSIRLPPGPVSVAQLMEAVAVDLDAWWGKLGETHVLIIDPRLQREGAVAPILEPYVLEQGLRDVIISIGDRGRKLLQRTNVLRPRQLSEQQRFILERLVRTALVVEPRLDPRRALQLEGVRLVFLAGENSKGSAGLEMLDRDGRPLIAMQVAMDLSLWDDIIERAKKKLFRPAQHRSIPLRMGRAMIDGSISGRDNSSSVGRIRAGAAPA